MVKFNYVVIPYEGSPKFFDHPTNVCEPVHIKDVCIRLTPPNYFHTVIELSKELHWTGAENISDAPPHIQAMFALLN